MVTLVNIHESSRKPIHLWTMCSSSCVSSCSVLPGHTLDMLHPYLEGMLLPFNSSMCWSTCINMLAGGGKNRWSSGIKNAVFPLGKPSKYCVYLGKL